jgi:long-chain acyl-CoA synthetase
MTDAQPSRAQAIAALTASGSQYELEDRTINGVPCRVFSQAPLTLRALFEGAQQYQNLDYLVFGEERLSYTDTFNQVAGIARLLYSEYGIRKGDRVAIGMRNYPEWITAFLAITSLGGIAVALNALWNTAELAYALELTGAKLLIGDEERIERLQRRVEETDLQVLSVRSRPFSCERIKPLPTRWEWDAAGATLPAADIDPDDDALIIFTSGSTGHPKGAVSSHRAAIHAVISWDLEMAIALWRSGGKRPNEPWDVRFRLLVAVPLFHVSGSHVGMLSSLLRGRAVHLMYKWDVLQALDLIEQEHITHFIAVSSMTGDLVKAAAQHQRSLDSLLSVGGGGAPRPSQQVRDIARVFAKAAPGTGWGMTETNAIGAGIAGKDYLDRPLSSGQCSAVLDMRIVDDHDADVPRGERGHLLIRGTSMFREYWNRPDANAEARVDGWFRTGDIAILDEEDFLFIVDRAKDIVIRGGENVGCGEVEDAIYAHPDVSEAVVFGLPHERLGEEVSAIVVARKGASLDQAILTTHLRSTLAEFQIPSRVFFSEDPLPRIASGKFNKRTLRLELMQSLGLETA